MTHSAHLYQAFFNTTSDSIFVVDAAAKTIVEANAQALNDTGYRPEGLNGLAIDRVFQARGLSRDAFSWNADEAGEVHLDTPIGQKER